MVLKAIVCLITFFANTVFCTTNGSCPTIPSKANSNGSSPININTQSAEFVPTDSRIKSNNGLLDQYLGINNGKAVEIYGHPYAVTSSSLKGGILCNITYDFHKVRIYFSRNESAGCFHEIDNKGAPIELHLIYYKSEYSSFNEALNYPDGIVIMAFQFTIGISPNPFFIQVAPFIEALKKPGSELRGSYVDLSNGHEYTTVTYIVASGQYEIIGKQQFDDTFMQLKDWNYNPLETVSSIRPVLSRKIYKSFGFEASFEPV